MNITKIKLKLGLKEPVRLLHIADTHLAYADDRDNERKQKLAAQRVKLFETEPSGCVNALKDAINYAEANHALLVHTGDMIDFVSQKNLATVSEIMSGVDYFFTAGNHEYSKYVGEAVEDEAYKADSFPLVKPVFPNDLRFYSRVIGGVNLVGFDNIYYHMASNFIDKINVEISKGLPIILFAHCPFYTPELFSVAMKASPYASIVGCPPDLMKSYPPDRYEQQCPTAYDMAAIDYLKSQTLIRAVFTGHLHYAHESRFSETALQYAVGAHFDGIGFEVEVV
jgi:3',5'-cyclic AMP phosphodiesterase CpdA